ncbi:MAG: aminotransferase class IV [Bacteroidota bacterium]|nr:aminotransferase class IV [Bacteroidota bacterium]
MHAGYTTGVMTYLNFNGSILPAGTAIITADNPGFRFGDGLFETIRMVDRQLLLSGYHFDRLYAGAQFLGFDLTSFPSRDDLSARIRAVCDQNGHGPRARVRLTIFRQDQSPLEPQNQVPGCLIQSWPLGNPEKYDRGNGLTLGIFHGGRKSCDLYANLKSNNYLIYTQAASFAQREGWDDCLILNSHDRIADSSISNFFYCRDGRLYTPPLTEGCVAGVMRRFLLEILPGAGFPIEEKRVIPADLESADEVFLTNAIRGIRRVGRFNDTLFGHELTDQVDAVLNKYLHFPR